MFHTISGRLLVIWNFLKHDVLHAKIVDSETMIQGAVRCLYNVMLCYNDIVMTLYRGVALDVRARAAVFAAMMRTCHAQALLARSIVDISESTGGL